MKKFGGAPKCPVCDKAVYATEMVKFNDVAYHRQCLRCHTCKKAVAANQAFLGPDRAVYCRAHLPRAAAAGTGGAQAQTKAPAAAAAKTVAEQAAPAKPSKAEPPKSVAPGGKLPKTTEKVSAEVMAEMTKPHTGPLSERVFAKYDTDGDGSISSKELHALCMEMGTLLSAEQLEMALKVMDTDGNGTIEYNEFEKWWNTEDRFAQMKRTPEELEYLQSALAKFVSFDKDGNGTIERAEFDALHAMLVEEHYTAHTTDEDWADMDSTASGHVSFAQYNEWLVERARALEAKAEVAGATRINPFAEELAARQAQRAAKQAGTDK